MQRRRGQRPGHHHQVPDDKQRTAPRATAWAPQPSICDKQRAAPRAAAWAPRSSTCDAQLAAQWAIAGRNDEVPARRRGTASGAAGNELGNTTKYQRHARRREQQPGHHGKVPATHYERRRGQQPGQYDQVPETYNLRQRGQWPGHHDQVPATHNERSRVQRPGATINYLRRTTSGGAGYGLGPQSNTCAAPWESAW